MPPQSALPQPDPAPDARDTGMTWDDLIPEIGVYMEVLFILNSPHEKEVWQYIIGVAAHLEYLAVAILWVEAGKPSAFEDYEDRLTLGGAADRLRDKKVLDAATIETLKAVAKLRNSVAHRGAVSGVTLPGDDPTRRRGTYKASHVFSDPGALQRLVDDANAAITAMGQWLRQHDGRR